MQSAHLPSGRWPAGAGPVFMRSARGVFGERRWRLGPKVGSAFLEPGKDIFGNVEFGPWWQRGAGDQGDGQAKDAGGVEFGPGGGAPGILGHDPLDPVPAQEGEVAVEGERATCDLDMTIRQGWRSFGRIDEAEQVVVLRLCRKGREGLAADGEEDALVRTVEGCDRGGSDRDIGPVVTRLRRPGWPGKRGERDAGLFRRHHRVSAHLSGEGMAGVDQVGDTVSAEPRGEALSTAEASGSDRQGVRQRCGHPAGKRNGCRDAAFGHCGGEQACLGRAAEYEEPWGHG